MADFGIKRVTVTQNNLPPVTITDDRMFYFLRYRIASEDKNRQSHWSPIYRVVSPPIKSKLTSEELASLNSSIVINSDPGIIRADWTLPKSINNLKEFDVYYRFNYGPSTPFIFGGTVAANSFSAVIPDIGTGFEIAIQIPTFPKIRFNDATIFLKNTNE